MSNYEKKPLLLNINDETGIGSMDRPFGTSAMRYWALFVFVMLSVVQNIVRVLLTSLRFASTNQPTTPPVSFLPPHIFRVHCGVPYAVYILQCLLQPTTLLGIMRAIFLQMHGLV